MMQLLRQQAVQRLFIQDKNINIMDNKKIKELEDEIARLKKIINAMQKHMQQLHSKVVVTGESVRKAHSDISRIQSRR